MARTVAWMFTVGLAALLGTAPAANAVVASGSGGTTYQGAQGGSPAGPGTTPGGAADPSVHDRTGSGATKPARSGGSTLHPRPNRLRDRRAPVLTRFDVSRRTVFGSSAPVRITYRIRDRSRTVKVTLAFVRPGHGTVFRASRGWQRTGVSHTYTWSGAEEGRLVPEGSYEVRVIARDRGGNRLVRGTTVERAEPVSVAHHRFPVQGLYNFGGAGARFGAPRTGHRHQGQDIIAAQGTPVVAPTAGVITWRAYQAEGAGYYLVLHASAEPYDYVFMHLARGSLLVSKGDTVTMGQQLGSVGATGVAEGPHLHFEAWDGPWFNGGHAVDPLPILRSWVTVPPVSRSSR